jgi:hypothetical protein
MLSAPPMLVGSGCGRGDLTRARRTRSPQPTASALASPAAPARGLSQSTGRLDITYRVGGTGGPIKVRPYTLRVQFLGPRGMAAERRGGDDFVAVSDASGTRVYGTKAKVLLVVPPDAPMPLEEPAELYMGGDGKAIERWRRTNDALVKAARSGKGDYASPGEGSVAGRACLVVTDGTRTIYVDKQLGITLKLEDEPEGSSHQYEAIRVAVGRGVGDELRLPPMPLSTATYAGRLEPGDAQVIRNHIDMGISTARLYPADPTQPEAIPLRYVAPGFVQIRAANAAAYDRSDISSILSGGWCESEVYVNTSGGTIEYWQGSCPDPYITSRSQSSGATSRSIQLGTVRGALVSYEEPYAGSLLSWERNGFTYFLDGTKVDPQELVKMARSTL